MGVRKDQLVKVELEIRVPVSATEEQVDEWLHFSLLQSGSIHQSNPLYDFEPEAFGPFGFDWEPLTEIGWEEEYDHQPTENGGKKWKVRMRRERIA